MRRLALALPLLIGVALAQEQVDLDRLPPAEVYQRLTGQARVPADAPQTLPAVLERTGHDERSARRLLSLHADPEPLEVSWLNARAVAAAKERASAEQARLRAPLLRRLKASPASAPNTEVAALVLACYRAGARDLAEAALAKHPQAVSWSDLPEGARIECVYEGGGQLRVRVARARADGPLAIAFPPGLGARPSDPGAQHLALLEAAVLTLGPAERSAAIELPTACAGYGYRGPAAGRRYHLQAFPRDGVTDRLLNRVCRGPVAGAPAQLAVWIADDRVTTVRWSDTRTMTGERVRREHADAAASLLLEGGVDPRQTGLFVGPSLGFEP